MAEPHRPVRRVLRAGALVTIRIAESTSGFGTYNDKPLGFLLDQAACFVLQQCFSPESCPQASERLSWMDDLLLVRKV